MPSVVKIYGRILEITEYEKTSKKVRLHSSYTRPDIVGRRRIDSLRRAKQICVRKLSTAIEEMGSPLLITLTFKGSACDAYASGQALSAFFRRLRVAYPHSHALFVPEVSPAGRIHFHGLLFGVPSSYGDIRRGKRVIFYGSERHNRTLQACWKVGFLDCRQTDGSGKLAYYLTKYLTKHGEDGFELLLNGLRLVRCTVGFPTETVLTDSNMFSAILEKYKDEKPLNDWQSFTHFTGKISKKKYQRI